MSQSASSPITVNAEVNREDALELRKEGLTYRAIATKLSISKTRAHELVQEALKDLRENNREKASQIRDLIAARYDAMLESLWPKRDNPRTADTILRIEKQRAELFGVEAPKRLRLGGEGGGPIQTVDATPVVQLTDQERLRRIRDLNFGDLLHTNGNGNGRHN